MLICFIIMLKNKNISVPDVINELLRRLSLLCCEVL